MMKSHLELIILTAMTCLCFHNDLSSGLMMKLSPKSISAMEMKNVNVYCAQDDVNTVQSIQLQRGNDVILSVDNRSIVSHGPGMKSNFLVQGSTTPESYIRLTMTEPSADDGGSYVCLLEYADQGGQLQSSIKTANLTVTSVGLESALQYMETKSTVLQNEIRKLETDYEAKKTKLNSMIASIKTHIQDNDKMAEEETTKAGQESQRVYYTASRVDQMYRDAQAEVSAIQSDLETSAVTFSARTAGKIDFTVGQPVVYSWAPLNLGNGYNNDTGVFTAPVAGIYFIHLAARCNPGTYIYLDLMVGTTKQSTLLVAGHGADTGFSDHTCVFKLDLGQDVYVKVRSAPQTSFFVDTAFPENYQNSFSGYLIRNA